MSVPAVRDWCVADEDRELFDRELNSFVPDRIFDAHAHLYSSLQFPADAVPSLIASGPEVAGLPVFRSCMNELLPGRDVRSGLFFPFPHARLDVGFANQFLIEQVRHAPSAYGQLLITPAMSPADIFNEVRAGGLVGLKCYHVYSSRQPTFDSLIEEFLTEDQARLAHELQLSVTLHLVRARALADPDNQRTIRSWCQRYPGMKLILAHAARGFNPHHTMLGIESLAGLQNVWFDTSVVTDSGAIESIARVFGHERILYGSDFPVTHLRGRCVALGDSFLWISADNTRLDVPYASLRLSLVGHESLRTLKVAAMSLGWTDHQIEDVFCNNATRLFAR